MFRCSIQKYVVLLLISVTLLLSGCSVNPNITSIGDIRTVNLNLNSIPPGNKSIPLHLDDPGDKEIISKILGWLNAAELVGADQAYAIQMSGGPPVLEMELENGDYVYIEPELDSKINNLANGNSEIETRPVHDQVVVRSGEKVFRVNSTGLYAWISGGWIEDINK